MHTVLIAYYHSTLCSTVLCWIVDSLQFTRNATVCDFIITKQYFSSPKYKNRILFRLKGFDERILRRILECASFGVWKSIIRKIAIATMLQKPSAWNHCTLTTIEWSAFNSVIESHKTFGNWDLHLWLVSNGSVFFEFIRIYLGVSEEWEFIKDMNMPHWALNIKHLRYANKKQFCKTFVCQ